MKRLGFYSIILAAGCWLLAAGCWLGAHGFKDSWIQGFND
jgi:hypothetical protein